MSAYILDTETTGLEEPQPVEVAWLRLEGPERLQVIEATTGCAFHTPVTVASDARPRLFGMLLAEAIRRTTQRGLSHLEAGFHRHLGTFAHG